MDRACKHGYLHCAPCDDNREPAPAGTANLTIAADEIALADTTRIVVLAQKMQEAMDAPEPGERYCGETPDEFRLRWAAKQRNFGIPMAGVTGHPSQNRFVSWARLHEHERNSAQIISDRLRQIRPEMDPDAPNLRALIESIGAELDRCKL